MARAERRNWGEEELSFNDCRIIFAKVLGSKLFSYLEQKHHLSYHQAKKYLYLSFCYEQREVLVTIPFTKQDFRTHTIPNELTVSFYFETSPWKDFLGDLKVWFLGGEHPMFFESREKLEAGSIRLLKYLKKLAKMCNPETTIVLIPSTPQRERFYKALLKDVPTIKFLPPDKKK